MRRREVPQRPLSESTQEFLLLEEFCNKSATSALRRVRQLPEGSATVPVGQATPQDSFNNQSIQRGPVIRRQRRQVRFATAEGTGEEPRETVPHPAPQTNFLNDPVPTTRINYGRNALRQDVLLPGSPPSPVVTEPSPMPVDLGQSVSTSTEELRLERSLERLNVVLSLRRERPKAAPPSRQPTHTPALQNGKRVRNRSRVG
eukprot:TRINITY_DN3788_c0_g1_i2.p1 TRINITY_DN3788_c0_g1~~TRINITY_DN3788_c0_g1_i2.p1  ORF type:complete len:202 (-),score=23.81 TRINITY_DN3788_c0_g1_i2:41-646(-)